jgi:hypothetical protein
VRSNLQKILRVRVNNFMKINNFFRGAFLLGSVVLLAGCVTTQGEQAGAQLGDMLGRALTGSPSQPRANSSNSTLATSAESRRGFRSIAETELYGLFNSNPLRTSNGRNAQYPRVAITVDDHVNEFTNVPRKSQCYFMHARIWDSQTKSRAVGPFSVCGSDIKEPTSGWLRTDSSISIWNSGIGSAGENHSGGTRTEGPQYPQRPIPSGPLDTLDASPSYNAFYFIHGTLTNLGFDFSQADPRVWFVKFGKLDPAGFQAFQDSAQRQGKSGLKADGQNPSGATTSAGPQQQAAASSGPAKVAALNAPMAAGTTASISYQELVKLHTDDSGDPRKAYGKSVQVSVNGKGEIGYFSKKSDGIAFVCDTGDKTLTSNKATKGNIRGMVSVSQPWEGATIYHLKDCQIVK